MPPLTLIPEPLTQCKVLDLGQVVAGNFCGAALAYFGADVIKVEPPGKGDALRALRAMEPGGNTSLWWRSYVRGCQRGGGGSLLRRRWQCRRENDGDSRG